MIDIVSVVILFIAIAWVEGLPLYRQRHHRELIIFSIVLLVAFSYALPVAIGLPMPNPVRLLDMIFSPLLPMS